MSTTNQKLARQLGPQLVALRERRGLTQLAVERTGELSPGQIGRLESGERMPLLPSLVGLARALRAEIRISPEGVEIVERNGRRATQKATP